MKNRLTTLALLFCAWAWPLAAEEVEWSKVVHGLRARLIVMPAAKDDPFCRVYLEMQNVGDIAGEKKIGFSPGKLSLKVTNEAGKELSAKGAGLYDGASAGWTPLFLRWDGTLKFRINSSGFGYAPGKDRAIIDMGDLPCTWVIPQNGSTYYLSGFFAIAAKEGEDSVMDWHGHLEFPRVKIPAAP